MLAQDSFEMRRKNLNSTSIVVESSLDSFPKTTIRRITTLIDQLCGHVTLEQPKSNPALQDISLSSTTDIGSEDEVSYADS
ncbi:hypothetical protein JHK87_011995 [Glycine soja]|nr:hypothetical protein JHK87_011995 [Glycine soja]